MSNSQQGHSSYGEISNLLRCGKCPSKINVLESSDEALYCFYAQKVILITFSVNDNNQK